jgi:hypothetical protein
VELSKMQIMAEDQDEKDKDSISLLGGKDGGAKSSQPLSTTNANAAPKMFTGNAQTNQSNIEEFNNKKKAAKKIAGIDPKCLSCSGQASSLLQTFKLACIAYAPNAVSYRNIDFKRTKLLAMRKFLVN